MAQQTRAIAGRLMEISLDEIEDGPNIREADAGLRRSVLEHGILQPITVAWRGGHFEVLYGHRRLAAARAARLSTIPAIVEPVPADLAIRQLVENLDRRGVNAIDQARAMRTALDADPELTGEILAKRLGRRSSWVSNRLALLNLPEWTRAKIASGALSPSVALRARPRLNDGRGRPRVVSLPDEAGRSRSLEVGIGDRMGGRHAHVSIGVDHDTGSIDLVAEAGDNRILMTLSAEEARVVGRRLTQAYEALAVAP
jgi:ParB/RepB/Spo0J family partition protein